MATGSEVSLALDTLPLLSSLQLKIKIVSMPSWELFDEQEASYKDSVLNPECTKRVSIEAGVGLGWQKYVGSEGLIISFDQFGHSAPAEDLAKTYGFVPEAVSEKIKHWLNQQ